MLKMSYRVMSNFLRPHNSVSATIRSTHDKKHVILFNPFDNTDDKNKKTYMEMIKMFDKQSPQKRGHVEFIYAALRYMKEFGVHKDLESYKALIDVFPKGRFVPTNVLQSEFMHYPKQQQCAIDLLEQMEDNGVMPDSEMETNLLNIFGKRGFPLRKFWRMAYWMPKFRNLSPWPLPQKMPDDPFELAKMAIKRITSVDNEMEISIFDTKDVDASLDHTWIVSAQSPHQVRLLSLERDLFVNNFNKDSEPLIVRGVYTVRLKEHTINYFTLTATYKERKAIVKDLDDISNLSVPNTLGCINLPELPSTVHEQDDGIILAVCATGTSSRDSLLSWIRLLEKHGNPALTELPVIFTLTAPISDLVKPETQPAVT